jgi:hypothetical protein
MTLLAPDGLHALITTADGAETRSFIRTIRSGEMKKIARVTFPEKCLWENGGTSLLCGFPKAIPLNDLPDTWYRGEFSFDDVLGRVDLVTGEVAEVETKLDTTVDMIDLKLTENGSTLVFTDKKSGALWTVRNIQ